METVNFYEFACEEAPLDISKKVFFDQSDIEEDGTYPDEESWKKYVDAIDGSGALDYVVKNYMCMDGVKKIEEIKDGIYYKAKITFDKKREVYAATIDGEDVTYLANGIICEVSHNWMYSRVANVRFDWKGATTCEIILENIKAF